MKLLLQISVLVLALGFFAPKAAQAEIVVFTAGEDNHVVEVQISSDAGEEELAALAEQLNQIEPSETR